MKRLIWLFMLFSLIISGCAINGNVMRASHFGYLYEGILRNPSNQYTVIINCSAWKEEIVLPCGGRKSEFLPQGKVYFLYTYYDEDGEIVGVWEDSQNINPTWRKYYFEGEFFWWEYVTKDPRSLEAIRTNLLRNARELNKIKEEFRERCK